MLKSASSHAAHFVTEAVLGLVGLVVLAGCVLAWRLAQGPIDITTLAQRAQTSLTRAGATLTIGHAALTWEGFRDPCSPIAIRVTDVRVGAADGTALLRVPLGRVTLSVSQLLLGRIAPRRIEIDDAAVDLRRTADGQLMPNVNNQASETSESRQGGNRIMSELAQPARDGSDQQPDLPFLSQLRHVTMRHAHVTLNDASLGVLWRVEDASADLTRRPDGGVLGDARLALAIGSVHATLTAHAQLGGDGTHITASTTDINPSALAVLSPAFAGYAAIDANLHAALEARLAPDLSPEAARLTVTVGAGTLRAGTGTIPIRNATATLDATQAHATLRGARLEFAPLGGKSAPVLTLAADINRSPQRVSGRFSADIDQLKLADLPAYWPPGTGGGSRGWVLQNVTSGTAKGAHIAGTIEAGPDFSGVTLKTLSGGLTGEDLTLSWLRPIPPLQHANAKLVIDSPDALRIFMTSGQQKGLKLTSGTMRITGLAAKDQFGQIEVAMEGGLPDALSLLAHPRLNLLSRLPFPVIDPAGQVSAQLAVHLPLDDRITMDEVGISAEAALADVHLGQVAASRDLDDGQLTMNIDTHGLLLAGDATLAGIPSTLTLDMDFHNGPPTQPVQHVVVYGVAGNDDLVRAGLPNFLMRSGTASIDLDYIARRNASADLSLSADLAQAALTTPFAWSKKAGEPASAAFHMSLQRGRITGIDRLHAEGPHLKISSSLSTDAGRMRALHLGRVEVGRTDLHGTVILPVSDTDPWRVTLAGPLLDLSGYLQTRSSSATDAEPDESRGPPWSVALNFGRVILAKDESLSAVSLSAASNGLHISRARLSTEASKIDASITPNVAGRHLAIDAADAGAVLLAANIFDNIRGGHLTVNADYNDSLPHAPLSGTATLAKFRLLDAPAVGRLLKAMTFYGAVDLLRGPGLGFAKAVAPFAWEQRVLQLKNARAFSASLGLTVQGRIDLRHHTADLTGTIVPAYFFNQLLGNIPVLGKLFSPEKGGGVFAARYSVKGKLSDPAIGLNPLSALTPGLLRNVFGLL
jgi:hypothetical protein